MAPDHSIGMLPRHRPKEDFNTVKLATLFNCFWFLERTGFSLSCTALKLQQSSFSIIPRSPKLWRRKQIVASVSSVVLALVGLCSAQSTTSASTTYIRILTTIILLPSALFSPVPLQQNFTDVLSTSSSTTFYNLYIDEDDMKMEKGTINFLPAQQYNQYILNGYPFSACSTGTKYMLPKQK